MHAADALLVDDHILRALREDMPHGDLSACAVVQEDAVASVSLMCKQSGVIAGLEVFCRVFELLDDTFCFESRVRDGQNVVEGQLLGVLRGRARALLSGERTALNYLQRMSGIATYTRCVLDMLDGTSIRLVDTRKTTPGMRYLEKWAVRLGGGSNHRFGLSDGVMLKDNHIAAAGGIKRAVERARASVPFTCKIEVEVETLGMVQEALEAHADIIMLDNMDAADMRKAVALIAGRAEVECSGNVTVERIAQLRDVGVDVISCGALTHSAGILDLSLKGFTVES